jgi:hypothetical protein
MVLRKLRMKFAKSVPAMLILLLALPVPLMILVIPVKATTTVTIYPTDDAYVTSDSPSTNYGSDVTLQLYWDYASTTRWNIYLKFDLRSYSGAIYAITNATLGLYVFNAWFPSSVGYNTTVGVHSCTNETWIESQITWANAPSYATTASNTTDIPSAPYWQSWNVTGLVQNALGHNMTLVLKVEEEPLTDYYVEYRSKDATQQWPELIIEYNIVPEFPSFLALPLFIGVSLTAFIVSKRKHSTHTPT